MQTEAFRKWEELLERDYQRECEKQSVRKQAVVKQQQFYKTKKLPTRVNRLKVLEDAEREEPSGLISLNGRGLTSDNMEWIQRRIRLSEAADLAEQKSTARRAEWKKSQDVATDSRLVSLERRHNRKINSIKKIADKRQSILLT